jgi:hypothetical protein
LFVRFWPSGNESCFIILVDTVSPIEHYVSYITHLISSLLALSESEKELDSSYAPVKSSYAAPQANLASVSPWQELIWDLAPAQFGNLSTTS